jgi:hypothetical protein
MGRWKSSKTNNNNNNNNNSSCQDSHCRWTESSLHVRLHTPHGTVSNIYCSALISLIFYPLRGNVHTADTVLTKIMPISFSVALGILNIFEGFNKHILFLTALTALNIDAVSHTLRFFCTIWLHLGSNKNNFHSSLWTTWIPNIVHWTIQRHL